MCFDFTPQQVRILIDALSMPQGVPKHLRSEAEQLRAKMRFQTSAPTPPKLNGGGRIRSSWPTGDVQNTPRPDWAFTKPAKVRLPKATTLQTKTTVEDVLKGLI